MYRGALLAMGLCAPLPVAAQAAPAQRNDDVARLNRLVEQQQAQIERLEARLAAVEGGKPQAWLPLRRRSQGRLRRRHAPRAARPVAAVRRASPRSTRGWPGSRRRRRTASMSTGRRGRPIQAPMAASPSARAAASWSTLPPRRAVRSRPGTSSPPPPARCAWVSRDRSALTSPTCWRAISPTTTQRSNPPISPGRRGSWVSKPNSRSGID